MLRVGLTGGIACGKSHVLARLAAAGCHTLDLDRVAHDVMAPGGVAYDDVVAAFGPRILASDGSVDRKTLGAVVFADAAERARLNAIVHPKVRDEEARRVAAHAAELDAVFVTDAALLVESGIHLRFDRLIVVHCPEEEQLRRLTARDGIDAAAARARAAAQKPVAEKRGFAHLDVDASGSLDETSRRADAIAAELRRLAAQPPRRPRVPRARALGGLVHGPARGPRGLDPAMVLREIAAAGALEMERLARCLSPPHEGPWYRAARAGEPGPGPETLGVPVALWALARRGADDTFIASVAASVARLSHADPVEVATACLLALGLAEVARYGAAPADLGVRMAAAAPLATRWGGAAPAARLEPAFRAAAAHPSDVAAARAACAAAGGDPALAGALVGLATGADPATAPPAMVADLEQLDRVRPRE